jgi:hypothetical protein
MSRRWLLIFAALIMVLPIVGGTQTGVFARDGDATPTEIVTESPSETPTVEPTATEETATPTETPSETATTVPSATVTETGTVVPTNTSTATATSTSTPTATTTATSTPPSGRASDLSVSLTCTANPEQTRIDNLGANSIVLNSIESLADKTGSEPYVVNRTLGAGRTVIFRSGSGATSGTILTTNELYTNSKYNADGVKIVTSGGTIIKNCAAAPPKPSPTPTPKPATVKLRVTVSCRTNPETTRIDNIGTTDAVITTISSIKTPGGPEPIMVNRKLGAGKTVIYRSNSGATTGTILTTKNLYDDGAYDSEGVRVRTTSGQTFTDMCDARPAPTPQPTATPRPQPTATPRPTNCDPSYPSVCIRPVSQGGDLDCSQIGYRNFPVVGSDPHRFDADNDGIGCES